MFFRLLIVAFSLLFSQSVDAATPVSTAESEPVTSENQPLNYDETNKNQ